jgi:hypothetical protein
MLAIGIIGWRKIVKGFDAIKDLIHSFMTQCCDARCDGHTTAGEALPCVIIKCSYLLNIWLSHLRLPALLLA